MNFEKAKSKHRSLVLCYKINRLADKKYIFIYTDVQIYACKNGSRMIYKSIQGVTFVVLGVMCLFGARTEGKDIIVLSWRCEIVEVSCLIQYSCK